MTASTTLDRDLLSLLVKVRIVVVLLVVPVVVVVIM